MKRTYRYKAGNKYVEREYAYIPFRYILAIFFSIFQILAVIGIVVALCYWVPYFYFAAFLTSIGCVLSIIASNDNPDYKVPWLLFVLVVPIGGFMCYLMFYSRKLKPKFIRRLEQLYGMSYQKEDDLALSALKEDSSVAFSQAKLLSKIAGSHLFTDTHLTYYPLGQAMHEALLLDLEKAQSFIYMEYFIIEEGVFWDSILAILKQKAQDGVEIKVIYDDIGCMTTLPGDYHKKLGKWGIQALPFSRLRGSADSECNNRSHRKITVIDGKIGYTGGINFADEYINQKGKHGHWKDTAIRMEGEAVWELTRLVLSDFGIHSKQLPTLPQNLYPKNDSPTEKAGYVIPFGDGPRPIYPYRIGKSVIMALLHSATECVLITTPYLIIDNELCVCLENTALRGVDVKILLPHIPDKKLIFTMTQSFYPRLMEAGVKIYQYTPGFLHAKSYVVDGKYAMIGTINLDYRSLAHHFENGVWLYKCPCIADMVEDITNTLSLCTQIKKEDLKTSLFTRLIRTVVKLFAPML